MGIGLVWLATWNRATADLRLFNSSKRGWSWLCESINPVSQVIWLSSSLVVVLICQQPLLSTKISSNITWEKTLSTNWIQLIIDYRRPNYDSTRLILRKIQWLWRSMAMLLQGWKIRWHWRINISALAVTQVRNCIEASTTAESPLVLYIFESYYPEQWQRLS